MKSNRSIFVIALVVGLIAGYLGYCYETQLSSAPVPQPQPDSSPVPVAPVVVAPLHPTQVVQTKPAPKKIDPNIIPGERVLRFKTALDYQHFLDEAKKRGINIIAVIPGLRAVRISTPPDSLLSPLLQQFSGADAGANYVAGVSPGPPPDLTAKPKTALQAFDQNWTKSMGTTTVDPTWGQGIKVAIVDTGVDPSFTIGGVPVPNIDLTVPGASDAPADSMSHATAVASLITGGNNMSGIAPATSLLSIQALGPDGSGDTFTVAEAIVRAVDAGSQVINLSLGSYGDSAVMQDAVAYAESHGVALVASAGNDGVGEIVYPAQYAGVLAVGSVDASMQPAYFSNYGTELAVMAPGVGLPAGQGNSQAVSFSGTSASAATVSGALAAILSSDHTVTPTQAMDLVRTYADDVGVPGADPQSGSGTVDVQRVLDRNTPNIVDGAVSSQFVVSQGSPSQPLSLGVTIQNRGTTALVGGTLTVQIANAMYNFPIQNLAPSQSVMETVPVYPVQMINNEAVIRSQLNLSGSTDSNPANNTMQSRLRMVAPTQQ